MTVSFSPQIAPRNRSRFHSCNPPGTSISAEARPKPRIHPQCQIPESVCRGERQLANSIRGHTLPVNPAPQRQPCRQRRRRRSRFDRLRNPHPQTVPFRQPRQPPPNPRSAPKAAKQPGIYPPPPSGPGAAASRRSLITGRRAEAPPLRALPPARSCHGVRARLCKSTVAAARSLRRLSSPRPSASPLTRSASGSGLSQPPTLTRGLLHVNLLGAPGPRVTPSQRLQRPALWGIRACVY